MTGKSHFPIDDALPRLTECLSRGDNAVLVAPPGAGKTTRVAPEILEQPWCTGQVLMLVPRRIAVRSAAEFMAFERGEKAGATIGYLTRLESAVSAASRIVLMTPGVFVNRIIDDPELAGVSAVLFDEVHERALDSDFALALALEAQAAFRPDLKFVAMSATIEGERFSRLLGNCPIIESEGRSWPLDVKHIGRRPEVQIEDDMVRAVRLALNEREGDVLAFLPGVAEIRRTAERLEGLGAKCVVHLLHGQIDPHLQRMALKPDPDGRRKVILATSIAETSITVDGVRIVVDSGLSRRPKYDVAAGVSRLETVRVAQSTARQRAGRAARQGAGVVYRLWEEAATSGLPAHERPEVLESDLAPLVLRCAQWGECDPSRLSWLDPLPSAALARAREALLLMGAIENSGAITAHGAALASLAMPPELAHMLLRAAERGQAEDASDLALLLQEPRLGGRSEDLEARLDRFRSETGSRAKTARSMAQRWARQAEKRTSPVAGLQPMPLGVLLSLAYPRRLARRRDANGENWESVGGRSYKLRDGSPLAGCDWLAVADVQGQAAGARILSALAVTQTDIETHLASKFETFRTLEYRPSEKRVEARIGVRLGALTLKAGPDHSPDPEALTEALLDAVRQRGLSLLPMAEQSMSIITRARFAGLAGFGDESLIGTVSLWLAPLLAGQRDFSRVMDRRIATALENMMDWDQRQLIQKLAPPEFLSPLGTLHPIDYAAEQGPTVSLRVQALFGVSDHPVVGSERIPLVLELLSPAGRPLQTTRDLPGFWRGSWTDVVRDMRGRYPKHRWPDDPASERPSLKTKAALAREK